MIQDRPVQLRPAFDLSEYLLLIRPQGKAALALSGGPLAFPGEAVPGPFIVLASFFAKEMMEATLSRWLQNICNLHRQFGMSLNNVQGIASHTIHIAIEDPRPLMQLVSQLKMLDGFIQSNDCPPVVFPETPCLTLFTQLPAALYEEAIGYYQNKKFDSSFEVKALVLVKRAWSGAPLSTVHTFPLAL